jgi:small-conductance mechanosensitive channel
VHAARPSERMKLPAVRGRFFARNLLLMCAVASAFCCIAYAENPDDETGSDTAELAAELKPTQPNGVAVEIDGRPILTVYASIAGISPEERVENIKDRILRVAKTKTIPIEDIRAEDRVAWSEVLAGSELIMAITENDAKAAGHQRHQLALEDAELIRRTVASYRQEHTLRALLQGLLLSFIATVCLVLGLWLVLRIRRVIRRRVELWIQTTKQTSPPDSGRSRIANYVVVPLIGTGSIVAIFAILSLLHVYVTLVLRFFPSTRYTSIRINRWTSAEIFGLWHAFWNYLPNLVLVIVIAIAARYLIRLNRLVFSEIQEGRLTLHGFYPDWGPPTAKLVRLLILAGTAVVMFPYLPGSTSPAFRGISVFVGVLLSLGSTSAVAHGVAGTILTYMRSFTVGDFVRIGDTVGQVVEKNLLVTRVRTQKNEIVTIPNGSVLGGVVVNYTLEARKNGVIFHTTVSIGYDAPWKRVHELLVAAAHSTKDVLETPAPFVLQSSLDDFYVSYELNVFTLHPEQMLRIHSDLCQNIQDTFNEAGVEINSPHYASIRDGNRIAIPAEYVSAGYETPAFGIRERPAVQNEPRAAAMPNTAHSNSLGENRTFEARHRPNT